MDMVLQTVGLTKQYGSQFAVNDLNMNVEKRQDLRSVGTQWCR